MMNFVKTFLAVLAGMAVSMALIIVGERLTVKLYPMPEGIDPSNHEAIMHAMPMGAYGLILVNYMIASFAGGLVATLVSKRFTPRPAIILGAILTFGGLSNDLALPHPVWFVIINVLLYVPAAYVGYMAVKKKTVY